MKVITFSRHFPANHPRKGEPTFFVEKIWESIYLAGNAGWEGFSDVAAIFPGLYSHGVHEAKHHTIRAGNRWKVGDKFSPRIWSGKPYRSKQIQFAPYLEIKKIWDIRITECFVVLINGNTISFNTEAALCENDGLDWLSFTQWFACHPKMKKAGFVGQILCWNENINYV